MKLGVLKKLRTRVLRRRERCYRDLSLEPVSMTNLYRPRLRGRIEALDGMVDDIDAILKRHHDAWHTRKAQR